MLEKLQNDLKYDPPKNIKDEYKKVIINAGVELARLNKKDPVGATMVGALAGGVVGHETGAILSSIIRKLGA
jgi:uncharacterized protein YcfJ